MFFDETAWVAIAFVLFIILVWKKGSQAITSMLDNRSLLIENELNQAKSLKEEALEELRQTLQIQKNISEEADNIIKEAKENAKKIIEEAKVKSSEIIKRKEDQANQKILALETEAINNIKKISSNIIIESSKTYINQKLNAKEKANLITKSSNEIKSISIN
ncbi:MAG: hypothetical protein ACO3NN_01255 [Candidatus Puniceispirillales bacterium]|jgi:F-type H+-transporting ATPase subunit b|nr:hypothetical protein [Alphaproteobacteria bacterium]MBL6850521.1 hypothetical protein [Alphaproteobacteria bacterium]